MENKKHSSCLHLLAVPLRWSWWICRILVKFFLISVLLKKKKESASMWNPFGPGLVYSKATSWMKDFIMLSWMLKALGASVQHCFQAFWQSLVSTAAGQLPMQKSDFSILPKKNQNICFYLVDFLWYSPGSLRLLNIICCVSLLIQGNEHCLHLNW